MSMVRILTDNAFEGQYRYIEAAGLASDTKPTKNLVTGSRFLEVDTGVSYAFDEESKTWTALNSGNGKTSLVGATVTLGSALTYDGTEKTKAVSSVVIGTTTLTADTDYTVEGNKATEVGYYTLYIIGKGSYTGIIAGGWSIGQGTGSLTASPDTLSLTAGGDAGSSTLTVTGDGEVSAESSDEDVATVSVNGTAVTVTPLTAGSATVTVTLVETVHYSTASDTISVTVSAPADDNT